MSEPTSCGVDKFRRELNHTFACQRLLVIRDVVDLAFQHEYISVGESRRNSKRDAASMFDSKVVAIRFKRANEK